MAIHIKLSIFGTGLLDKEKLQRRLEFGLDWVNYLNFEFKDGEVWLNAPLKELGGERIDIVKDIQILRVVRKIKEENVDDVILVFNGTIQVENKKYPGTLYIHNTRKYRSLYGDIEFDTSEPIEDILIKNEKLWGNIEKSIKVPTKGVKIESFHIGYSPDVLIDFRERLYTFAQNSRYIVYDLIRALKFETEEDPVFLKYKKYLKPYDLTYLSEKIDSYSEFKGFLADMTDKAYIIKEEGNSISLRAKEKDSFRKFYSLFRDDFLGSIKDDWYDEDKIDRVLKRWIGKYASIV